VNFDGQTRQDETIEMDDGSFIGAKLIRCRLVYRGGPMPHIPNLTLIDSTWDFRDAASTTLVMLAAIGRVNPSWASQLLTGADKRLQAMLDQPVN
jgi:hypothetical protein